MKYRLTRLHCGGDKSLLVISYANFLTVFRQFSDDSKYLSSCHKEVITARICSLKGDAYVVQIAIATGFYMWYCRWQLRFILSDFQCLQAFIRSFPLFFFFLSFFWGCFVFTSESRNLLKYMKNIHFSSSLERPIETSRRNTASW